MTEVDDTKLERYKLQTEFSPDGRSIEHTTYKSSLESGVRRVVVKTRWYEARQLGFGGNGVVFLQRNDDGQYRAVKRMYKEKGVSFRMELKALTKSLDREELFVQFFGWFEDRQNLYIAMEFIKFGDLSQYIKDPAMKHNARQIATQVLEGIDSLHKNRICHRDLKPQNILMASVGPVWVKIADFGCSKYHKDSNLETKRVGTQPYNAPELHGLGKEQPIYTNAIDMWSLGCIIHEMLTSKLAFSRTSAAPTTVSTMSTQPEAGECTFDHELLSSFCLEEEPKFPTELLEHAGASSKAINLIRSLLRVNPAERPTAESALQAPWIVEEPEDGRIAKLTISRIEGEKGRAPSAGLQTKDSSPRDLIKAAVDGDVRTLSELLALKPDTEQRNDSGETALLAAVRAGMLQSVNMLVKHGANLKATLMDGSTPLLVSVQMRNTEMVRLLLDQGVDVDERGKDQRTALITAAGVGDVPTVSLLLDRGASPEAKQKLKQTARMIAARLGVGITRS
ncbi:uncharacterized protein LAJ45_06172 [Morchella importuna]|uniref:uncharacterized protein n=1 Tax=Morchella importuna TaxID=1174673 RepID=UPI001E8D7A54|nr:uncharacterized protein LAJ45_06172 [Morchella importuna]KAH8149544.1 hypothetical protein LAJ45_06172 [Morchella importuna]